MRYRKEYLHLAVSGLGYRYMQVPAVVAISC